MTKAVVSLAAVLLATACTVADDPCYDEDDNEVACERLDDDSQLAETPDAPDDTPIVADNAVAGPDDLDGLADEAVEVAIAADPEAATDLTTMAAMGGGAGSTAIDPGRTKNAERRKFLPIGRTGGASRFVVMRLKPSDLPRLDLGDTLRGAAEIQVTTRCDIGQAAPGCNYSPHVRLQLVLSGSASGTNVHAPGTIALSGVHRFDCTKDDHHCVKTINFSDASATLGGSAPPCVRDNSCFVNLVAWAYNSDARSGGADKLLLGANEGDFLQNGNIEQDRGRVMVVRERGITPADVSLRETKHDVRSGSMQLASTGDSTRIYSHTLAGGRDLRAGEKFRVWAEVDASSNGRVNLSLEMFLTKNRFDKNGGAIADTTPRAISEHNGTNCSPGNDCHLRKVALFAVDRDIRGPVFVNIAASTEVPGPGSATTTIHDSGFIKAIGYAR